MPFPSPGDLPHPGIPPVSPALQRFFTTESLDAKCWLTGKDPDAGKDWRQKEKRVAEDEVVREHHWRSGHEFEPTLGDCERRGSHGVATAENSNYCRMFLILQILWKGFGDPQGFLWILFWGLLVYLHFIRGLQNGDTPVLITLEFVSWSVL